MLKLVALIAFAGIGSTIAQLNDCEWGGFASQGDDQDTSYLYCDETTGEQLITNSDLWATLTVPIGGEYGACLPFEPNLDLEEIEDIYGISVRPFFQANMYESDVFGEPPIMYVDQYGEENCIAMTRRVEVAFGQADSQCTRAADISQGIVTEMYFSTMEQCEAFQNAGQTVQDQIAQDSWLGSVATILGFEDTLFDPWPLVNGFAQTINPALRYEVDNKVQEKSFSFTSDWQPAGVNCYGIGKYVSAPYHVPVVYTPDGAPGPYVKNDIASVGFDANGDGFLCGTNCAPTINTILASQADPGLWAVDFANSTCAAQYGLMAAYNESNAAVPGDRGLGAGNYALANLMIEIYLPRPCGVCQEIVPAGQFPATGQISSILGRIGEILAGLTGDLSTAGMVANARYQMCQTHKVMNAHLWLNPDDTTGFADGASGADQCFSDNAPVTKVVRGSATISTVVTTANRDSVQYAFATAILNIINPNRLTTLPRRSNMGVSASLSDKSSEVTYEIEFTSNSDSSADSVSQTLADTDATAFGNALNDAFSAAGLGTVTVSNLDVEDPEDNNPTPTPTSAASTVATTMSAVFAAVIALFALAF